MNMSQLSHKCRPNWLARVREATRQEPLIETRPTLAALEGLNEGPPRAVFVGLGICSTRELSTSLPVDVLGMLLPAERIRRAAGAKALLVLLADEHAASNGLDSYQIKRRSRQTLRALERIKGASLPNMRIIRASSFHGSSEYQEILAEVRRRAPLDEHPYFIQEAADIEYLYRRLGGIVKVGWTIGPSAAAERRQDEVAFDRRFRAWIGHHVGFVYCKAGRTLDPKQPKACPYIATQPAYRICLEPGELVARKVRSAERADVARGLRNHLKRIARCYNELVQPLSGPTENRIQELIAGIFSGTKVLPKRRMTA